MACPAKRLKILQKEPRRTLRKSFRSRTTLQNSPLYSPCPLVPSFLALPMPCTIPQKRHSPHVVIRETARSTPEILAPREPLPYGSSCNGQDGSNNRSG